ncbi:MAG: MaoC family dehydratase [Pseudomonadales bacterium]
MTSIHYKDADALNALVSEELGDWSSSITVDQAMISQFADLTGDHMWMHVDEERCAKESPFGCTIAHGFLILSLQSKMTSSKSAIEDIEGYSHIMNYGSDKLRFLGAVPVNSELHSRSRVKAIAVSEHKTTLTLETHIHIVDQDKPGLIYELMMVFL